MQGHGRHTWDLAQRLCASHAETHSLLATMMSDTNALQGRGNATPVGLEELGLQPLHYQVGTLTGPARAL